MDPNKHWYGFALSLLTALLWGVLPIFLKLSLEVMDAVTITWYRFLVAGVFVFIVLYKSRSLPQLAVIKSRKGGWLILVSFLLVANYVSYVQGLEYLNPESALVIMQLAPFLLMLGSIIFFSERFSRLECVGACLLLLGLILFFNDRLATLFLALNEYTLGVLIIVFSAVAWAGYALMQKSLLKSFSAKQLTLYIYLIGMLMLLPFVNVQLLSGLDAVHVFALIFCCLNTIVGYGAFTEALSIWQASKVGAIITLAPVFTFISMYFAVEFMPQHFVASELDKWAYIGGAIVVMGSAITSLGKASR